MFQNTVITTYFNKKMATMLGLGFASGFPFLLVFSTLSLWLKEASWTYAAIGAFSLVKLPYALKWLVSPFLDKVKFPFLWRMGRRRSWGLALQLLLFGGILAMSAVHPEQNHALVWICAGFICTASACLDIVLDAYRVESFANRPEEQASGSAVFVLGYRIGLVFSGAGALTLATFVSWHTVYLIMAFGTLIGFITLLSAGEPNTAFKYANSEKKSCQERLKAFWKGSIIAPFTDFAKHRQWPVILALIFIYRMSDAYFGPMSFPFYDDMGFSKFEIAYIIKIYGMAATIIGGLFGGLLLKKVGILKGLYICGFTQGLTTLMFSWQALSGHNLWLLTLVISLENFSSGMATTALVAYISSLCNVLYTATQYALLSSIMSVARDVFASTSGILAEYVNWPIFFAIAAAFSIPGIMIVKWLMITENEQILVEKQNKSRYHKSHMKGKTNV